MADTGSATAGTSGRVRRPLRCGEPTEYWVTTQDGVSLRLTRFQGGSKGPVVLTPGFGTSVVAYTIDTTDTNLPEYLFEHGYDVWILEYRASPDLVAADTQFTLDEVAKYDYPAGVAKVLEVTGAPSVQMLAHCIGSLTALMALQLGLQGVRSLIASQTTLHVLGGTLNEIRSAVYSGDILQGLGFDQVTTDFSEDPSWGEKLFDKALAFWPQGEEPCDRPFCRRQNFMFGESYRHENLNEATHDHIAEAFGVANLTSLRHVMKMVREDHAVSFDGSHDYLDGADGLKLPIHFLHGELNRLFVPEGSRLTYEYLSEANGPENYSRQVIPGYAHMDLWIGKDAARDVYPLVTAQLDPYN